MRLISKKGLERLVDEQINKERIDNKNHYRKQILDYSRDLMALQSQINPHFLYNSLECIRGLAIIENSPEIAKISENLSNFFRYSINMKQDTVTLREELENVKNYINIQQFRFQDKFSIHYIVDDPADTILDYFIPKLTLQPLVENALIHGLKDTLSGGDIKIQIEKQHNDILIHITDNGKGIEQNRLIEIQNALADIELSQLSSNKRNNGVALLNVHHRLQLLFGYSYGLEVKSAAGLGTRMIVRIPVSLNIQGDTHGYERTNSNNKPFAGI